MKASTALAALLAASLAACGVNKGVHQKALDRIGVLEGDLSTSEQTAAEKDRKIAALTGELDGTREVVAARDETIAEQGRKLSMLEGQFAVTQQELVELRRARDAAEKRIAAYRELQGKFRELVDTGRLEVLFRNGQMVIKLPSGVLFKSASADLSADGETALAETVRVLDQFKDRRFLIAGHTDNRPIKTRAFPNNWYLSTARAISVLQFMIDAGFPAQNLGAAGYGDQDPIKANDNEENREQNRRIEIILVPNLEELPSLTGEAP
ncbi:MAG: OmpA family protein [Kofleriaceae bacterium]